MDAVEVLREFFAAMCEWERRAYRLYREASDPLWDKAPLVSQRAAIIARFCTPKRRAFSEPFSCGDPTIYDPDIEDVIEVVEESAGRVVVHTQQRGGFAERRKYIMLRRGDRWLLDNWQSLSGGKWVRGII